MSSPTCHLDSHADTCAFGMHCMVLATYSESVDVSGFHSSMDSLKNIKIAKVAVAYDCPLTFQSYVLIFDQVLYIPSLECNLLCVDQMRDHGVTVNDVPLLHLAPDDRHEDSHSILVPEADLRIGLLFDKPISFFECRKPTRDECSDDINNIHVIMTGSVWEPYDQNSTREEQSLLQSVQGDTAPHRTSRYDIAAVSTDSPAYRSVHPITLSLALGDRVQVTVAGVQSSGKNSILKPDQLARGWRCSLECARRTLDKTTQRAVRDWSTVTGAHRFRPTQFQLEYPRIRCDMHVDVKFGPCKSIDGNTCVAVYATPFQWARGYGLQKESDVHETLKKLFRDVGFPRVLRPDDAKSLTEGSFRKVANKGQVPIHPHEPYHPNQNLAEDMIREATRMYHRFMTSRNIIKACWDRVFCYCLELRSNMALGHPLQEGECGATIIKGSTSDISHLTDFSINDWCWALSPTGSAQENKLLTRWMGPSFDIGAELCFACLTAKGTYLHRSSVIPLNEEERNSEDIKSMKRSFQEDLKNSLKARADGISAPAVDETIYMREMDFEEDDAPPQFELYEDDEKEDPDQEKWVEPPSEEADSLEFDRYVGAKIRENLDGVERFGVVIGRKRENGQDSFIGRYHENQFLDTSIYEIEWEDGAVEDYRANQIVEALLSNVDDQGNTLLHMKEIVDHRRDGNAVYADDAFVFVNGRRKRRRTTKGWHLCTIELHGGETEWIDLKSAKEAYPIEVAEYAVANKLVSEPAFAWWVPYTLKKRDRILSVVKKRAFTRKTEKFGLELPGPGPRGVRRAYEIDRENGTEHWSKAMEKEVKTVLPALKVLEENDSPPPGYTKIDLMTVFDVKMDLTRKARICARGDQTDPPLAVTYASVVTRESIRLGFMLAALNGLKVLSADIAGAYLNAPCAEKIYTILGPEFGELEGRTAIVVKALYGLKSSGFSWRSTLARSLREPHSSVQRSRSIVWMVMIMILGQLVLKIICWKRCES